MTTSPIPSVPMLIGAAADRRLDGLTGVRGSRKEIFVPTLRAASHGFGVPGRLAPPSAAGLRAWADGTEELRVRLEPFDGSVPADSALDAAGVVLLADGTTAIALVSGDEATGLSTYSPQVRYPRGATANGYIQGSMLEGYPHPDQLRWWYLLHRVSRDGWRAELSLPGGIGKGGWVTTWRERIQIVSDAPDDGQSADQQVSPDLPPPTVRWRESA